MDDTLKAHVLMENLLTKATGALALRHFPGRVLLLLSACDYTAKEFLECAQSDPAWRGLLQRPTLQRVDVADADHTFSKAIWRAAAEQAVLDWMRRLEGSAIASL